MARDARRHRYLVRADDCFGAGVLALNALIVAILAAMAPWRTGLNAPPALRYPGGAHDLRSER
jgi:hypothetical protein